MKKEEEMGIDIASGSDYTIITSDGIQTVIRDGKVISTRELTPKQ